MTDFPQKGCALVTGAGGRLGKLLRAANRNTAKTQIKFLFQSRSPGADFQWSPGQDATALPACDALVALWGVTGGSQAELAQNTALVETGTRLARRLGARRIIHMSSAAVYGAGRLMEEGHGTGNTGAYGLAKCQLETAVAALPASDGITHICLRLGNVVGADSRTAALRGETSAKIDRFDSGIGPLRSYIGATDLLQVLDALLALPANTWPPVLNIASPRQIPMEALMRAAGQPFDWRRAPDTAIPEATLDVSRMQALLPDLALRETAEALIADWRQLDTLS